MVEKILPTNPLITKLGMLYEQMESEMEVGLRRLSLPEKRALLHTCSFYKKDNCPWYQYRVARLMIPVLKLQIRHTKSFLRRLLP